MAFTHSGWGVDGVSLVESSTNGPAVRGPRLSTACLCSSLLGPGGCGTWWGHSEGGLVFGTLLGPEESDAHPAKGWFPSDVSLAL
jgi:hypothetical protein